MGDPVSTASNAVELAKYPFIVLRWMWGMSPISFYRRARPNVEFAGQNVVPMPGGVSYLELVFVDRSGKARPSQSRLRDLRVSAHWFFSDDRSNPIIGQSTAQFSDLEYLQTMSPLPDQDFRVTVGLRHSNDDEFYAFNSTIQRTPTQRDENLRITAHDMTLRVRFAARGYTSDMWFALRNKHASWEIIPATHDDDATRRSGQRTSEGQR